jgi:hypothetical protein
MFATHYDMGLNALHKDWISEHGEFVVQFRVVVQE